MRRIRYWTRLFATFVKRFKWLLFLSAILGVSIFLVSSRLKGLVPLPFDHETIGLVGRFTVDEIPVSIQSRISLGLTVLDEQNEPKPGIATSWRSEEDGRVWIFTLGELKWQDGKKVVAKDINYNFSDVLVEVIDEKTIKFVLADPFAPFPSVVSRPIFRSGLLGTGQWKVTKLSLTNRGIIGSTGFVESIRLVNVKNDSQRTYRFYPTEDTARTAFKLGEINRLEGIVSPQDIVGWKNSEITRVANDDRYVGIFINTIDPIMSDKGLRQALAYAIDKENFGEKRAISPISPSSWAFNSQVKQYEYNPGRAKELLNDLPKEQRESLTLNLVTTPSLLPFADRIKGFWENVGIDTNVQVSNTPPQDFQALLAIQAIPPDPDQYSLWHSTQGATNITNYGESEEQKPRESQRIDKLLEDGRRTLDQEERKSVYLSFQRFLVEDSPVIFLFHPSTYTIERK